MATTATSNPPSSGSKPSSSPVPSASTSSLHSTDGNFALPPSAGINGNSARQGSVSIAPQKKPAFSSRISGMFSRRDTSAHTQAEAKGGIPEHAVVNGDASVSSRGPTQPTRSGSTEKPKALVERSRSNADRKTDQKSAAINRRFYMTEDGLHEHHLRVAKRNEKLSDMFQNFMGKKKEHNEGEPLSLMANWVDQLRSEKNSTPEKFGPNGSQTLVQKYGKCQEIVGRGAFGIVRVAHKTDAKDPKREELYAVKEFRRRPQESVKKYNKRLTAEFCLSSSMHHPNIITTLDLLQDDKGDYCEVMEYCAGGDLYTLILSAEHLEVLEADCFFKQLMRGVEYMHEMGVAHRDLKPENLLLTSHGAIKITDFGNGECFRMAWEEEPHLTAGLCGSAPYIAPEEYVDSEFDPRAVDVWACGIIYMAMRTGRHLWRQATKGEDEFFTKYLEDRKEEAGYKPIEQLRRRQCRNVIYSILDPNPTRRLTAHQVLHSEWVKDIKVCHAGDNGA